MMESLGMSGRIESTRKDREYLESLGMPGRTGNTWKVWDARKDEECLEKQGMPRKTERQKLWNPNFEIQNPRSKRHGIKFVAQQSCGVFATKGNLPSQQVCVFTLVVAKCVPPAHGTAKVTESHVCFARCTRE